MRLSLLRLVRTQWFLFGIVGVIALAWLAPSIGVRGGPIHPEYTVKYVAVAIIFFSSGITLKTEELKHAVFDYPLHCTIQGFSLGLFPIVMLALVKVLRIFTNTSELILTGFIVVGCMPPPVSSAVILTKAVGGNEAGAIFNSALGSMLGIVVTPVLLLLLGGIESQVPFVSIFLSLTATVVFPLLAGQVVRAYYWPQIKLMGIPFSEISSSVLLLIIYSTFCDTFDDSTSASPQEAMFIIVFDIFCLMLSKLAVFVIAQLFNFSPRDTVCILFCATHKSLTLGIPILKIVFGSDPSLSIISLPLLVYHPGQILLGGLLVPGVRAWMETAQAEHKF